MKGAGRFLAFVVLGILVHGASRAGFEPPGVFDRETRSAVEDAVEAFRGVLLDDREVTFSEIDSAEQRFLPDFENPVFYSDPALSDRQNRRIQGLMVRCIVRLHGARDATADPEGSPAATVGALRRATRSAWRVRRALPAEAVDGFDLRVEGDGLGDAGTSVLVRASGTASLPLAVSLSNDGPGTAVEEDFDMAGSRTIRLRFGSDAGLATLAVDDGTTFRRVRLCNLGPRGSLSRLPGWGGSGGPPASLSYPASPVLARVGVPLVPRVPVIEGGSPADWNFDLVDDLPDGLSLDWDTGVISGTPEVESHASDFRLFVFNVHGAAYFTLSVEVAPALPAGVEWLEDGFAIDPVLTGLSVPVKMALAPDGRLFFSELSTGNIRVVAADGTLRPTPFATVAVQAGAERGLLGIALDPSFASNGSVFAYATVPADEAKPVRGQILRFTANGDLGGAPTVVVDDLPSGLVQNGGDLQFGPDGMLYLTVGDTGDSTLAQADGALAGRILRYAPDGSIPADNPDPAGPEWVRGLRNSFDMAFHAPTGGLFASENGPTFGDELNFIQRGRNYGWETLPPDFPGPLVGRRLTSWTPVIVPTGIAFHDGTGFGAAYADALFLAGYDDADVRRILLSGPSLADYDAQFPFARFDDAGGVDQKPLDLLAAPDGDLLVSTFTAIWRIERYASRAP